VSEAISGVVVNYNGAELLAPCLDSLLAQTHPFGEIVVVDNASRDASASLVQERFPSARLLALDQNVGYAEGCNRGIASTSGELVAVLNNDVVLDPRWLESLLAFNQAPWSFWASLVLYPKERGCVDSAGDGMAVIGAGFKTGHGDAPSSYTEPREVFGPCAAAALYRRSLLEATGGFDPDFFLIYEDADLSLRARLLGFRCVFVPSAIAYHHVNSSIGTYSHTYVFYGHRNSEYVFWKNMPLRLLLLYLPERLLFDLLSFVYFAAAGRAWSFLKAKADFIRHIGQVIAKRRRIQRSRVLKPSDLRQALTRNWLSYRLKTGVKA
jgi:GT2 family glycosyltransferase